MLYVCVPVHNEANTVGVLLWRLRTVLQDAGRDYEVVVFDDASTDATAEVLAPYARVLPLTVLGGAGARRGWHGATDALLRHVVAHSRYPRRDACAVMQADFTDRPEHLLLMLAAFDAGADLVSGRRPADDAQPPAERRLRRVGAWALRPLVRVDGVDDLLTSARLFRVQVLRDLVRARGDAPLVEAAGWAGVADLMVSAARLARRVETVDAPARYDVRQRASRLDWPAELRALARYAWRRRGTHVRPGEAAAGPKPGRRRGTDEVAPAAAAPGAAPDVPNATPDPDVAPAPRPPRARPSRRRRTRPSGATLPADAAADAPPGAADALGDSPGDALADAPVAAPDAAASDAAAPDAATPARRRKRRPRRRSTASAAKAAEGGPAADDAEERPPLAEAPAVTDALLVASDDAPPAARAGRARRRRRPRSGSRPGGVENAEGPPPAALPDRPANPA